MTFIELVVMVHRALARARLRHAFGGALALAYIAEPRGTVDIDVNVFVAQERASEVAASLSTAGLRPEQDPDEWLPSAGIRFRDASHPYPVDVFPSVDDSYDEIAARCVRHPFGPESIRLPFLSPEDLVLFKLSFGRAKDWVDLRSIAVGGPVLDLDYVERKLIALRGPSMYPRLARLRALLEEPLT